MAKNDSRVYASAYRNVVKNKIKVSGYKYDERVQEVIENIDDFRQCYKKGDKIREQLPRYWFISREGFLISVRNKKEPKWIKPNLNADRPEFKISRYQKSVTVYTLVALVWDSFRTGNAKKILDKRGIQALGKLKKENGQHSAKVQGHHVNGYIHEKSLESYITNNNPEFIQIVTVKEHDSIHKIQKGNTGFSAFYQPDFMNIPNDEIQIYDREKPRILDFNRVKIEKVTEVAFIPLEKDSIVTDGYIFVLEDGRNFLEEKKEMLLEIAKEHPPKFDDIRLNQITWKVDDVEKIIFYQKI